MRPTDIIRGRAETGPAALLSHRLAVQEAQAVDHGRVRGCEGSGGRPAWHMSSAGLSVYMEQGSGNLEGPRWDLHRLCKFDKP